MTARVLLPFLLVATAASAAPGPAEERGLAVLRALEDASRDVASERVRISMVLEDRGGRTVTREAEMAFLDDAEEEGGYTLIRFTSPPDLRGTAFLTHRRGDDAGRWLYLPALGRVKRIAASRQSGNFAGTEFTYEDLGGRELDSYRHRYLREEFSGDDTLDVVESVPRDEHSGYARIVTWVSRARPVAPRVEYYDRSDRLLKVSVSSGYHRPDGIHWRFREAVMENVQTGRKTRLTAEEWNLDAGLDASRFTVEALKESW